MVRRTGLLLSAALLVAACAAGGVYVARHEAYHAEYDRLSVLSRTMLERTETIAKQSRMATARLNASKGSDPCSGANLALMRQIDLGSSYLQAVGHVESDRLMCSSFGDHGDGIPLGAVAFLGPDGDELRPRVQLPLLPGRNLLVAQRNGSATFVHPSLITDALPAKERLWAGIVNVSHGLPMVLSGELPPAWLDHVPPPARGAQFEADGHFVAMYRPLGYDYVAFAASPRAKVEQQAGALAWRLGLVGGLVGLALWWLFRWEIKRLRSFPAVMRAALDGGQFYLEYQPIVELETGRWVGAEALMRWRRPDGAHVRPDIFIPVAEDNGFIERITAHAIKRVGEECGALLQRHPDFYVAINFSSSDLASERSLELLGELTRSPGFAPHNIAIEATERGLLNVEATRRTLKSLRDLGVRAAIDDFGTGYSGLSYLGTYHVDTIKIDKSFVDTIGTDAVTSNVAIHIIELAKSLHLQMVAEGIEHAAQADFLQQRGVRYGQGWFFARSMPMANLLDRLADRAA